MRWELRSLLAVGAAAAAVAVPVAQANPPAGPPGNGLFPHDTTCYGGPFSASGETVHMMLTSGTSLWIGNMHFVIQSATITYDDPALPPFTLPGTKVKAGLTETTVCSGHFPPANGVPGYSVESIDVLVK